MNTNLRRPIATLALLALAVAACGDDDDSSSDAPTSPGTELADGRHFGYLAGDGSVASFDRAEFLTGATADAAAAEDGVIPPGGEIENDYYVRNSDERAVPVELRDDTVVQVVDCDAGCGLAVGTAAALLERPAPTPVFLTVRDGVVVDVTEQYLP